MPRKTRTFYSGGIYHVFFRGNQKKIIYIKDSDYNEYISRFARLAAEENIEIFAHSIMPNHGHMILRQSSENPISRLMHRLQGGFTQYWNKKYKQVGHIYQGRYKCILCTDESYLLELVRYVHLNAPRAGLVDAPEDYKWCSHRAYLDQTNKTFLDKEMILSYFGDTKSFDEFVKSGLDDNPKIQHINLSIETAVQGELTHPIPVLSKILNSSWLNYRKKGISSDIRDAFISAMELGYKRSDIIKYLQISLGQFYKIIRQS